MDSSSETTSPSVATSPLAGASQGQQGNPLGLAVSGNDSIKAALTMARFSAEGNDMYICQECGRDLDGVKFPSTWTGKGNVCPACLKKAKVEPSLSLYEHCRAESGLTNPEAVRRYMNRYYGHG